MIPLEVLAAFVAVSMLLALSPGPDILFVLTQSAVSGPLAGIVIALGLCTGLVVHTAAVAFGVAVIIQTSALAFTVLKVAGAAYLLYLAWLAFRAPASGGASEAAAAPALRKLYLRGIIMNVSNPKVSVFFLAFLPQFADPERGALLPQIVLLGAAFALSAITVFSTVAVVAGRAGQRLAQSRRARRLLNRVAGSVFAGLAIRLLVAES